MRIVIASDKFKGSATGAEVATALAAGIAAVLPHAEVEAVPVADGGEGARELAQVVVDACGQDTNFRYTYELEDPVETKFEKVARGIYGADGIELSATARKQLKLFEKLGYGHLPVVIAKTHLSISSDPKRRGAPRDWTLPIRELRLAAGAGYIYAISGDMRTMPGLGEHPSAEKIDINEQGEIVGLF